MNSQNEMNKQKILKQIKIILLYSTSVYMGYLVLLSFALILHTQAISSNLILTIIVIIASLFYSLKYGLHPLSAFIGTYLFHWLNLATLNSRYTLIQFITSENLGFAAIFLEPWLHLITSTITSFIGFKKYQKNIPSERKQITYE